MKYFSKNKNIFLFILFLCLTGIFFGYFLGFIKIGNIYDLYISSDKFIELLNINRVNAFYSQFFSYLFLFISLFLIFPYIFSFIYLFYYNLCIGFSFYFLINLFGFNGFLFGIMYHIVFSLLFIVLLSFLIIKGYLVIKQLILYYCFKRYEIFVYIKRNVIFFISSSLILLFTNIVYYFFSSNILKTFLNML